MSKNQIAIATILVLVLLAIIYYTTADARGYHSTIVNNVNNVNNTYIDQSTEAMGACALGTAQAQIHPSIFSKHHQWGIGAGQCHGDTDELAVAAGYHHVLKRNGGHVQLIGGTIGRSTDEVTAIGFGYNNHFD